MKHAINNLREAALERRGEAARHPAAKQQEMLAVADEYDAAADLLEAGAAVGLPRREVYQETASLLDQLTDAATVGTGLLQAFADSQRYYWNQGGGPDLAKLALCHATVAALAPKQKSFAEAACYEQALLVLQASFEKFAQE